jgi:hypothetical protein
VLQLGAPNAEGDGFITKTDASAVSIAERTLGGRSATFANASSLAAIMAKNSIISSATAIGGNVTTAGAGAGAMASASALAGDAIKYLDAASKEDPEFAKDLEANVGGDVMRTLHAAAGVGAAGGGLFGNILSTAANALTLLSVGKSLKSMAAGAAKTAFAKSPLVPSMPAKPYNIVDADGAAVLISSGTACVSGGDQVIIASNAGKVMLTAATQAALGAAGQTELFSGKTTYVTSQTRDVIVEAPVRVRVTADQFLILQGKKSVSMTSKLGHGNITTNAELRLRSETAGVNVKAAEDIELSNEKFEVFVKTTSVHVGPVGADGLNVTAKQLDLKHKSKMAVNAGAITIKSTGNTTVTAYKKVILG